MEADLIQVIELIIAAALAVFAYAKNHQKNQAESLASLAEQRTAEAQAEAKAVQARAEQVKARAQAEAEAAKVQAEIRTAQAKAEAEAARVQAAAMTVQAQVDVESAKEEARSLAAKEKSRAAEAEARAVQAGEQAAQAIAEAESVRTLALEQVAQAKAETDQVIRYFDPTDDSVTTAPAVLPKRTYRMSNETKRWITFDHTPEEREYLLRQIAEAEAEGKDTYTLDYGLGYYEIEYGLLKGGAGCAKQGGGI